MSLQITVKSDTMTPDLRAKLAKSRDPRPIWTAGGTQILSITIRAFRDASMRVAPWPNKKTVTKDETGALTWGDGGPSNLIRKGTLKASVRLVAVNTDGVTVGSDRVYAAIHQLGGTIRPKTKKSLVFTLGGIKIVTGKVTMPARPYFPFLPDGTLAPQHAPRVFSTIDKAAQKYLGLA